MTLLTFSAEYLILVPIALALGYAVVTKRRRDFLTYAAFVLVLSYGTALVVSSLYYNPRPFVVEEVAPLIPHAANNGFPSDHALLAGALAAMVLPFNLPLGIVMWILAFAIGAARVIALVHHPLDIFASFVIVALSAAIASAIVERYRRTR